jgi:hypothetical protein
MQTLVSHSFKPLAISQMLRLEVLLIAGCAESHTALVGCNILQWLSPSGEHTRSATAIQIEGRSLISKVTEEFPVNHPAPKCLVVYRSKQGEGEAQS